MKIFRLTFLIGVVVLFIIAIKSVNAQVEKQVKGIVKGTLIDNLYLLNLWGNQPDKVNELYKAAYLVLLEKRDATFVDVSKNNEVQRICRENGIVHLGGPMLGNISSDGASVWIRTLKPSMVEVHVNAEGVEKTYGPVKSTPASDLTAKVKINGLKSGTQNPYHVIVDGRTIEIPDDASINTIPEKTDSSLIRIAFGTCFHRWGLGNKSQVDQILRRKPAAMLLGGDIAVADRDNKTGLHRADYLLRDFHPAWQHLAASVPVYATWDDHDYFNDDRAGIPIGFTKNDKENVWNVFRYAWNNPSYGFGEKQKGVFFRTRIGPCDIIMTDERYFRTGKPGSFLGEEQMKWLETQLLDCKGPFIILSSGTMWSDFVSNGKDSWGINDPRGRNQIFSLIEKNKIGGVLLISGDRHGARIFRIPRPTGYNFYEFEVASLGGWRGAQATDPDWCTQLFGISEEYAFGEFEFNANVPDPIVIFRLIHENGSLLYELKLTRSQLTP